MKKGKLFNVKNIFILMTNNKNVFLMKLKIVKFSYKIFVYNVVRVIFC